MRFFVCLFVVVVLVGVGKLKDQRILNEIRDHQDRTAQEIDKKQKENYKVCNLWVNSIYKLRKNGYFVKNENLPHRTSIGYINLTRFEYYCEVLKPGDFTIKNNTLYTTRPFKTWKYNDVIRVAAEL